MLKLRTLMLKARFSRVTKNKRLFVKNQLSDSFFSKFENLLILPLILPFLYKCSIRLLSRLYINFFQNFIKFGQFFQTFFFASLESVIDFTQVPTFTSIWSIPNFDQKFSKLMFFNKKCVWLGLSVTVIQKKISLLGQWGH